MRLLPPPVLPTIVAGRQTGPGVPAKLM